MSDAGLIRRVIEVRETQERELARLNRLQGGPAPSLGDLRAVAEIEKEFAPLARDLELSLPHPDDRERPSVFRMRVIDRLRTRHPRFAATPLTAFAIQPVEDELLRDLRAAARNPTVGSFRQPGALRRVDAVGEGGERWTEWRGDPDSWMRQFHAPSITCLVALGDGKKWFRGMEPK